MTMSDDREYQEAIDLLGAWSDGPTDYDYGVSKVNELLQFHSALGRPPEFEADVQRVYAAYERVKAPWYLTDSDRGWAWLKATPMKQVGAEAAQLIDVMRASGAGKKYAPSKAVPSATSSPVYQPTVDKPGGLPWWGWLILAVGVGGGAVVGLRYGVPAIARKIAQRGVGL